MEQLETITEIDSLYPKQVIPYYARGPKLFALLNLQYGTAPQFQITTNRNDLKIPDFNKNNILRGQILYAEIPAKNRSAEYYKNRFTDIAKHQSSPQVVKQMFQEIFY